MPEQTPTNSEKEGFGPMIGAVIIVGLLIIGGIYFLLMEESSEALPEEVPVEETNA